MTSASTTRALGESDDWIACGVGTAATIRISTTIVSRKKPINKLICRRETCHRLINKAQIRVQNRWAPLIRPYCLRKTR